jgi:hypothetical protein
MPRRLVIEHAFGFDGNVHFHSRNWRLSQSSGLEGSRTHARSVSAVGVGIGLRGEHVVDHGRDGGNLSRKRSTQFTFEIREESFGDDLTKSHGCARILSLSLESFGVVVCFYERIKFNTM